MPRLRHCQGAVRRRRVGGAGCGACGCASQAQAPGGLGSPSAPTTWDCLRWLDAGRTNAGESLPDQGGEEPAVRPRKHGPGDTNRRGGAPKGDAPRARARAPQGVGLDEQRLSALRPLTFRGHGTKARPAPLNSPGLAHSRVRKAAAEKSCRRRPIDHLTLILRAQNGRAHGKSVGAYRCKRIPMRPTTLLFCLALAGCAGGNAAPDVTGSTPPSVGAPAVAARPRRASLRQEGRLVEGGRRHPREDQRHVLDEIRDTAARISRSTSAPTWSTTASTRR